MKIGLNILGPLFACIGVFAAVPALAQTVTLSPSLLSFGNQLLGTSSSPQKLTLKNGQATAITITSIKASLSDYQLTNTCPASPATLAAGASCVISVVFTPSVLGSRASGLTVIDTGAKGSQMAFLSGTGVTAVSISPTSLSFGNQVIGARSAQHDSDRNQQSENGAEHHEDFH